MEWLHSILSFWLTNYDAECPPSPFYMLVLQKEIIRLAIHFSHFTSIFAVFPKHTTKYETLNLHFHISYEFCVLLMPQKNKPPNPLNPLTFCVNADPGAKCCEMRKVKKGARNAKYPAIHFLFFAFRATFL